MVKTNNSWTDEVLRARRRSLASLLARRFEVRFPLAARLNGVLLKCM